MNDIIQPFSKLLVIHTSTGHRFGKSNPFLPNFEAFITNAIPSRVKSIDIGKIKLCSIDDDLQYLQDAQNAWEK